MFSGFAVTNIFNSRKRAIHQRKKRIQSHMFAPQSIRAIEPISHVSVLGLIRQWDYLATHVKEVANGGHVRGELGSTVWSVQDGRVWIDCMQCTPRAQPSDLWPGSRALTTHAGLSFWAFDTIGRCILTREAHALTLSCNIGDLVFGMPFGMVKAGKDMARVAKSFKEGFKAIEKLSKGSGELELETEDIPYIETLSTRAESNASLGWLSPTLRWVAQQLPAFRARPTASRKLNALAVMSVARRLANPNPREDMLQRLLDARDDDGKPLSPEELSAEAFVLIVTGSDTIAK